MSYTEPLLAVFLLLSIAGVWRLRPWRDWPRIILAIGVGGTFLVTWPPMARLFSYVLEGRYNMELPDIEESGAIVVLSAGVLPPNRNYPVSLLDWDTYQRCEYAAWIHRQNPSLLVIAAGGGKSPEHKESFAATMRTLLIELGVPNERIQLEDRSTSTYENALGSIAMLRGQGIRKIVLVTQAYHMPRAEQSFLKLGMNVIPAPCGFYKPSVRFQSFLPAWHALRANERTLHEIVGLLWYKARGRA